MIFKMYVISFLFFIKIYPLCIFVIGSVESTICYDTKFKPDKYTGLKNPDKEIRHVRRESYCKTHCAANSSCAAYSYDEDTSTCYLSSEAYVLHNDNLEPKASVKMSFSSQLSVEYQTSQPTTTTTEAPTTTTTTTEAPTTTTTTSTTAPTEDPSNVGSGTPRYRFLSAESSWSEARESCQQLEADADLVIITTREKREALHALIVSDGTLKWKTPWIGARKQQNRPKFDWVDGTRLNDNDDIWDARKPNGIGSRSDLCVNMLSTPEESDDYLADDTPCQYQYPAICELPPSS